MEVTIIILILIFGFIVGSFVNALVYSIRKGKAITRIHSECPKCRHQLKAVDLVPVLSYLLLQGKCRYCKKNISAQYPVVELITAVIFGLIFWKFFPSGNLLDMNSPQYLFSLVSLFFWFFAAAALIAITIYDIQEMIIPDSIIYPLIIVSLIYALSVPILKGIPVDKLPLEIGLGLLAGIVGSGFFLSMIVASKGKWMGGGDVKLAVLMGFSLGWPVILVALMFSFIIGSVFGLVLIAFGKKKYADAIPFAPFLVAGTFIALFFGTQIITWYLTRLGLAPVSF